MVMIIFNLTVFFNVKVCLFSYFFDPIMSFFLVLVIGLFTNAFLFLLYFFFPYFFVEGVWGIFLGVVLFLMVLCFFVCGFAFS